MIITVNPGDITGFDLQPPLTPTITLENFHRFFTPPELNKLIKLIRSIDRIRGSPPISIYMLGNIIWSILKDLPFAVYRDKNSPENKNLSGRDYVTRKRRLAVSNWTDPDQWRQLITFAFWFDVIKQVFHIFAAALVAGVVMVVGLVIYFTIVSLL